MDFTDVILMRRTTRSYDSRQINEADLNSMLMAAHMAPIAGADYSKTHMTVVQDSRLLDEIRQACTMKSKDAKPRDPLYGAPTVIFFSAHGVSKDYIEYSNIGCAIENVLLAATNLDLGSTYIWGCLRRLRQHTGLIEKLGMPNGYVILSAVAVGYPMEPLAQRSPAKNLSVDII
ncbi:MAG: nitroreductase family protein [Eubacteriaceae bacterium]|nr:nitroreductase family protein [Eubacteriaceae bacterium]